MKNVSLRFYEELNDFLPGEKRKIRFNHEFSGSPSVKDLIESLGVPHTEIDMILVNSRSVDFTYNIKDGDDISVYPVFETFEITDIQHLRPSPLRDPKFILDVHLGSLTRYMRMAGFDALYGNDLMDDEIVKISTTDRRTILTKDRNLLKRNEVTHGYWIRNVDLEEQLKEVIRRFNLEQRFNPFSRCIECNNLIEKVNKDDIEDEIPPKVRQYHKDFKKCRACGRIYWKGSHYEKMHSFIDKLKNSL
jgi:uncharacterized protein